MADTHAHEKYLSPNEVAEFLGVDRSTVFRILRKRQMAKIKVGSATKIPLSSVHDYLYANTTPAETGQEPDARKNGARAKFHRAR